MIFWKRQNYREGGQKLLGFGVGKQPSFQLVILFSERCGLHSKSFNNWCDGTLLCPDCGAGYMI
jgi:hypothetical protein